MNKIIINGLKIITPANYLRIDKDLVRSVTYDSTLSLLYIKYQDGDLSDDLLIDPSVTLFEGGVNVESLPCISIKNKIHSINNLKLITLLPKYQFNQIITNQVDNLQVYNEKSTTLLIKSSIIKQDYLNLIINNPYLEIIDDSLNINFSNILGLNLTNLREVIYSGNNIKIYNPKSFYTKYIIDEVNVMYQVKDKILLSLKPYDIEDGLKTQDPDEITQTSNVLYYKISNSEVLPIKKHPSGILSRFYELSTPIDFTINTPEISRAFDIKHRYNNLELISNLTSFHIIDYLENQFRVSIEWKEISGELGDKGSIVNEGDTYSFQLTFQGIVTAFIGFDDRDWIFINKVTAIIQQLLDPDNDTYIEYIYENDNGVKSIINNLTIKYK